MEKEKKEKEFVEIKCPRCNAILKFAKEPKGRRVHAMCKNCLKEIEVVILLCQQGSNV